MLFFCVCVYVHSRINIISLRSQHVPRKLCTEGGDEHSSRCGREAP